jgi:hypothetical protein
MSAPGEVSHRFNWAHRAQEKTEERERGAQAGDPASVPRLLQVGNHEGEKALVCASVKWPFPMPGMSSKGGTPGPGRERDQ